jgi:hypothetical protein
MAEEKLPHVAASTQSQSEPPPKHEPEVDIDSILGFTDNPKKNLEKAILCVAYLLEWGTELGNEPMQGVAANGLNYILRQCARDL